MDLINMKKDENETVEQLAIDMKSKKLDLFLKTILVMGGTFISIFLSSAKNTFFRNPISFMIGALVGAFIFLVGPYVLLRGKLTHDFTKNKAKFIKGFFASLVLIGICLYGGQSEIKIGLSNLRHILYGDVPYMQLVEASIKRNWNPPKGFKASKVIVSFNINKQGKSLNIKVKESSKNTKVDQSAILAVKEAAPFPKLPANAPEEVPIEFTFDYK